MMHEFFFNSDASLYELHTTIRELTDEHYSRIPCLINDKSEQWYIVLFRSDRDDDTVTKIFKDKFGDHVMFDDGTGLK